MIKLLIGGSPCTYWSIAQNISKREKKAEGLGWELFNNYLIAKEKFEPDFFLYENNVSADEAIKNQIKEELGVTDGWQMDLFKAELGVRYIEINSALVSAQNRQRFYVTNCGEIEQPKDRNILLKDILETGTDLRQHDKSYSLTTKCHMATPKHTICKNMHTMVAEPVNTTEEGKSHAIRATCYKDTIRNLVGNDVDRRTCVAEPIPSMPVPEATEEGYAEIEVGDCVDMQNMSSKSRRGRSMKDKCNCLTTSDKYYQYVGTKEQPIYEVKDGQITINGKQYPIKLVDGFYIIRKLTVTECCRLQTMPDDYCRAVSNSQAYKGLGNGWTAEVIIHILNYALKDIPKDEEIVVLSMYDGIGTGRFCLDRMGFTNVKYYAYEIDKYAMQIARSNYPDIIHMGDAFQLREEDWHLDI